MYIQEAAAAFLLHCREERHLSPHTIDAYRQDLAEFSRYFGRVSVRSVSGAALVAFVAFLSGPRSLSPATVKRRIACLKSMFAWLRRRTSISCDPFATVEIKIRLPARLPRCVSADDMAKLAVAAEGDDDVARLAVLLLFATGVRIGELTSVRLADVDIDKGTIRILGKGSRERFVYVINTAVRHLLRLYVERHRVGASSTQHLLVTARERVATPAIIRHRLRRVAARAGLGVRVTPHMLRHTAATSLIEAGCDIRFVQRLLGHRSIATTQIYTHVSDAALRNALAKADTVQRLRAAA